MASRKQKKGSGKAVTQPTSAAEKGQATETVVAPTTSAAKKRARKSAKKSAPKARRRPASSAKRSPGRPKGSGKKSARARRYTPAERAKILAAAKQQGLSGPAAAKKFGISQLTYYTWRKKAGAGDGRRKRMETAGAAVGHTVASAMNIADRIRSELREQIQKMLPGIISEEIGAALGGTKRRRG